MCFFTDKAVVGGLGLESTVEEEGMVLLAEPRAAIVEIPEGDAVYLVAELAETVKKALVLLGVEGLDGVGHIHALFAEIELAAHLCAGTDIKFGNVDVLDERGVEREGIFELFRTGTKDVVMPLHSDSIDGHATRTHTEHHLVDVAALAGVALVVVVIEKDGLGVGLASELEGFGNELIATELIEFGLAIGVLAAVGHSFVDYIPSIDNILVAVHDRMDVVAQAGIEDFLIHELAFVIVVHPLGKLVVPDETMPPHTDTVLATEVGDSVCLFPSPHIGCGMKRSRLHGIFTGHTVELLSDEILLGSIAHVTSAQGHAHEEVLGKHVLEALSGNN